MTWIQTRTGVAFPLLQPEAKDVEVADIAHALSLICRFTGHVKTFYSVAEHCVRVAQLLPPRLRAYGLLHDAHEAYVGDIATPIQWALDSASALSPGTKSAFKLALESMKHNIYAAIHERFDLPWPLPPDDVAAIKQADIIMLMTEKRSLLGPSAKSWGVYESSPTLPGDVEPWPAAIAHNVWLNCLQDAIDQHQLRAIGVAA